MYGILNGMDGAGKGVQFEKILALYPSSIRLREPGGTPEAEVIRSVLLDVTPTTEDRIRTLLALQGNPVISTLTHAYIDQAITEMEKNGLTGIAESYLYAASRAQSNETLVQPALENNQIVLAERSVACSMAYQGHARGLGMSFVWELNSRAIQHAMPTFEIFLDVPPEIAQERLRGRTEKQDRLDQESFDFHVKSREGYLRYYRDYCPYDYHIIDASGSIDEVHEHILNIVHQYMEKA